MDNKYQAKTASQHQPFYLITQASSDKKAETWTGFTLEVPLWGLIQCRDHLYNQARRKYPYKHPACDFIKMLTDSMGSP